VASDSFPPCRESLGWKEELAIQYYKTHNRGTFVSFVRMGARVHGSGGAGEERSMGAGEQTRWGAIGKTQLSSMYYHPHAP
jgi:hypothetical protein